MGRCETCGNEYEKTFEITVAGQSHVFDSFYNSLAGAEMRALWLQGKLWLQGNWSRSRSRWSLLLLRPLCQ
jgi:hypothetical protein